MLAPCQGTTTDRAICGMSERGKPRVLIVEDSYLIAMETKAALERLGCLAAGPVGQVETALKMFKPEGVAKDALLSQVEDPILKTFLDEAVLSAARVWPVAERLEDRGVPFIFATGHAAVDVPPRFAGRPLLVKPVSWRALRRALAGIGVIEF